jgi:hypothetical protein
MAAVGTVLTENAERTEVPLTFPIKNVLTATKRDTFLVSAQISKMGEAEVVLEKVALEMAEVAVLAVSVGLLSASDVANKVILPGTARRKIQGLSVVILMEAEVEAVVADTLTGIVPREERIKAEGITSSQVMTVVIIEEVPPEMIIMTMGVSEAL